MHKYTYTIFVRYAILTLHLCKCIMDTVKRARLQGAYKAERKTKFQTRHQRCERRNPENLPQQKARRNHGMKYNLVTIMRSAWSLRREKGYTLSTALRLAWLEAKGEKGYTFHMENARAQITAYLVRLMAKVEDIHDQHKVAICVMLCCGLWMQWGLRSRMERRSVCASTLCATLDTKQYGKERGGYTTWLSSIRAMTACSYCQS